MSGRISPRADGKDEGEGGTFRCNRKKTRKFTWSKERRDFRNIKDKEEDLM